VFFRGTLASSRGIVRADRGQVMVLITVRRNRIVLELQTVDVVNTVRSCRSFRHSSVGFRVDRAAVNRLALFKRFSIPWHGKLI